MTMLSKKNKYNIQERVINKTIKICIYLFQIKIDNSLPIVLINEKCPNRVKELSISLNELILQKKITVIYTKSKLLFLCYSNYANIIYSYGLSKYASTSSLQMLYIGQVGGVFLNNNNYKVFQPPNFAKKYIADFVVSSVFAYERGILQNLSNRNNYFWKQGEYTSLSIKKLEDIKIGIIGLGAIGYECAILFNKIGCETYGYDIDSSKKRHVTHFYDYNDLGDMFSKVDYLVLAINNINNDKFIDLSLLNKMNANLCIVNISRASVIDEEKFIQFLNEKKIRGAILDVFESEPLHHSHPYWSMPNVIVSPHIAGHIDYVFSEIALHFVESLKSVIHV